MKRQIENPYAAENAAKGQIGHISKEDKLFAETQSSLNNRNKSSYYALKHAGIESGPETGNLNYQDMIMQEKRTAKLNKKSNKNGAFFGDADTTRDVEEIEEETALLGKSKT